MSRRTTTAIRLALLCAVIARAGGAALALTPEETVGKGRETFLRLHAILAPNSQVRLAPADRALLEKDKSDLQDALKGKDIERIGALVARATADLDRATSGSLQSLKSRYLETLEPLKELARPELRPLIPRAWPRVEKVLAAKGRVTGSQEANFVLGETRSAEEARAAATAEMRAGLRSLASSAAGIARGNEGVLAERLPRYRTAREAAAGAAATGDLREMIRAASEVLPLLPQVRGLIDQAVAAARPRWEAARAEAEALGTDRPDDLPLTDSGARIGAALAAGDAALQGGQADALRDATARLLSLLEKAPGEIATKRQALLAARDAKVRRAGAQLEAAADLKPETRSTLEAAAGRARALPAGASLRALTAALQELDRALSAGRAEASAGFKQALADGGRARACIADLKRTLKDLLPAGLGESLDGCLDEMRAQEEAGVAAGLARAAAACSARCLEAERGVCAAVEAEVRAAAEMARAEGLPRALADGLSGAAGSLGAGAQGSDCRGIDPGRLAALRRDVTRGRIALALVSAFATLYDGPQGVERALQALGGVGVPEEERAKSPLYQWSLAYLYFLKHRAADGADSRRWLEEARAAFTRAGTTARADLAGSGLFPDDFVAAMAVAAAEGS